jgi:carbon monoxide dehydrogenase subunit G
MGFMDMTGERRIPAPRQAVWDALNDPLVLQASIPGCQSLDKLSDREMKAVAAVKIGPISARFAGTVRLDDLDPPNGYSINGEGQGGAAGFAKGGAKVALDGDAADETVLRYEVHAQVGGKIAQLGGRLIDASAKQMADQFFDRFTALVTQPAPAAQVPPADVGQVMAASNDDTWAVRNGAEPAMAARGECTGAEPPMAETTPLAIAETGVHGSAVAAEPARSSPGLAAGPAIPLTNAPAKISLWAMLPRELLGLPLPAWVVIAVGAVIVLLLVVTGL